MSKYKTPYLPHIPMERGITVNLEASNHEAGWGIVQVEYTRAVTSNGHEHLIQPAQVLADHSDLRDS
jgi:hypothetical protein